MVAKHVHEMMTEAPHDSPTGQLIRTSIEQAKLELGLAGRLFDHDFKTVGHFLVEPIRLCVKCFGGASMTDQYLHVQFSTVWN
jgi:hypothetical protein